MLYSIVTLVIFSVLFSIGTMLLFVLYRRYCAESSHYSVVKGDGSAKASRSPLYPNLDHMDEGTTVGTVSTAPELDLSEREDLDDEKDSVESKDTEKISIPMDRTHETKAVENDYVVPSELNVVVNIN